MEAGKLHPFIKISLSFVRFLSLKQAMMRFPTLLRLPFAKYFIRANIMEDMKTKDEFSKVIDLHLYSFPSGSSSY